jgi:hypothetical protein
MPAPVITVYGHCAPSETEIRNAIEANRAGDLVDAHGDFVIVYSDGRSAVIVISRSGIVGYYLAVDEHGGRPGHGPDVATAARDAGLGLRWNHAAVADYLIFTFPLGTATFHPQVSRLPAGSVVRVTAEGARTERIAPPAACTGAPTGSSAPEDAVDALLAAVAADVPGDCALSMSGGLDSRLLLAALLALGRRPHLVISGVPGSFDTVVASAIGRALGLPVSAVTVTEEDVVAGLPEIAQVSNGVIPAGNWAGLAHARAARVDGIPLLLGFNGEIARGYYAPRAGYLVPAAARSVPGPGRPVLLGHRFESPFTADEQRWLAPELRAALEPAAVAGRLLAAVADTGHRSAFAMADQLFAEHYGRQKMGNDLAVITRYARWRAPLFAPAFTRRALALPLWWKLGDRFHRYAIARLCPSLLDAPEDGYGPRLRRRVPARYWLRGPAPSRLPFFLNHEIFTSPRLLDLLTAHAAALSGLVGPELLMRLRAEQCTAPRRPHAVFALQSMALWRDAARSGTPHSRTGARHD